VIGHHESENRVTQELEPLVGLVAGILGTPRSMGEGVFAQTEIAKSVFESLGRSSGSGRIVQGVQLTRA